MASLWTKLNYFNLKLFSYFKILQTETAGERRIKMLLNVVLYLNGEFYPYSGSYSEFFYLVKINTLSLISLDFL